MQTPTMTPRLRRRIGILRELANDQIRRIGTGAVSPRAAEAVEALHCIDTGSYGICTGCGEKIAAARLRAKPEAIRCVRCQDAYQRSKGATAA